MQFSGTQQSWPTCASGSVVASVMRSSTPAAAGDGKSAAAGKSVEVVAADAEDFNSIVTCGDGGGSLKDDAGSVVLCSTVPAESLITLRKFCFLRKLLRSAKKRCISSSTMLLRGMHSPSAGDVSS